QSLYRKWRSQTFEEIVGQQRITRTLRNALRSNRIAHAYLFCGPRGIGKTSAARVLAKAVNCQNSSDGEPCNSCSICRSIGEGRSLDVIEIDAASNRGIDEIRDLREKVNFAPSEATYKFYILDEVHMLTAEAFNALLKTLEEPPGHAIFVLVTTEPHRLPATILSRCQRFDFHRISLPDLIGRLRFICEAEGIDVDTGALELVGRLSTGSLRDAESLLDQLVSYCGTKITLDDVHMVVGMTGSEAAKTLAAHVINRDIPSGLKLINETAAEGADLRQFCREVVEYLRGLMLLKVGGAADLLDVTNEALDEMRAMADEASAPMLINSIRHFTAAEAAQRVPVHAQLPLELAFVEATLASQGQEQVDSIGPREGATSIARPPTQPRSLGRPSSHFPETISPAPRAVRDAAPSTRTPASTLSPSRDAAGGETGRSEAVSEAAASDQSDRLGRDWPKIMEAFGLVNKSIQALLRDCQPVKLQEGVAELGFYFQFHRTRIEDQSYRAVVEKVLSDFLGESVRVKCVLAQREKKVQSLLDDPLVKAAVELGARIKKVESSREDVS
ncbi:MAG: DNA polymerase III subunit gamma/tau, partial [Dehalococcoidales bacterium]|nr:DNA polymerase III subunit gamma/tau [Dehalococcoidales bacterium]